MIVLSIFYLLFLILLVLLIFLILLYNGYHTRTLAPPLLDSFYALNINNGNKISNIMSNLYLTDGANINYIGEVKGSIDFGGIGSTHKEFSFRPMWDDGKRNIKGNITLLINKQYPTTPNLILELIDRGDNDKVVAESTSFDIKEYKRGLSEIKLFFNSNSLNGTKSHHFVLRGKSANGNEIEKNEILLNSAYMYYY